MIHFRPLPSPTIQMLRRSMAAGMLLLIPAALRAQSSPPDPPLQSVLEIDLLRDLPASANVFAILETSQEQISSDRFYTGGLSTGEPARWGAQLASPGQNRFRIGEIDIGDPDGSGAPMLFPELLYWRSVGIFTGLMPAHLNAPGVAISLEPQEPTDRWSGVAEGIGSPGWVASAPIQRSTAHRATQFVGPRRSGRPRSPDSRAAGSHVGR